MEHIFKPGDKVYFHARNKWVTLKDASTTRIPHLLELEGEGFLTDPTFAISLINPFDPSDPNNPPEFRSDWPFMLRGRRLEVGMEMRGIFDNGTLSVRIKSLELLESDYCVTCSWNYEEMKIGVIHPNNLRFPDELPAKKKVAKWAYPVIGMPGVIRIEFTDEMTQEEAEEKFGSFIQMIPGTEREVEL